MIRLRRVWTSSVLLAVSAAAAGAQQPAPHVIERFDGSWSGAWRERRLAARPTRYEVAREQGNAVLMATSSRAASALWRRVDLDPATYRTIRWRWKTVRALATVAREREKAGDDYAARLFVTFHPDPFSPDTEAICYVWASQEQVGAVYRSPYAAGVVMVVVESGNARAGEWIAEERDVVADYERAFGARPTTIAAIAIMVDTDNTSSDATTWFDDIEAGPDIQ